MTREEMLEELGTCLRTSSKLAKALGVRVHAITDEEIAALRHLSRRFDRLVDACSVAALQREFRGKVRPYRSRKAR